MNCTLAPIHQNFDMYGGTRHSSALALTEHFSPEQIRRGTMHSTNNIASRVLLDER